MKTAMIVSRAVVGLTGLAQLVLGVLFWTGHALTLVPLHTYLGYLFVLALWTLTMVCARSGAPRPLVVFTLLWGFGLPGLGIMQLRLLPGPNHWMIRVAHLLMGVVALGLAGAMTARVRRAAGTRGPGRGG